MKKIISLFLTVLTCSLIFSSCAKEDEDTYVYSIDNAFEMHDLGRLYNLLEYVESQIDMDHIFMYTGKESVCDKKAIADFQNLIKEVDNNQVTSFLKPGEYFELSLVRGSTSVDNTETVDYITYEIEF